MLDILHDRFYWPNMEVEATHHVCTCKWCLRFRSKQDEVELYLLLAIYPLELVHMDFLTIENPCTSADMNTLVITDHFTWYVKAIVTPNQSTRATVTTFQNEFIANYGFPEKFLMDQGHNFELQLIKELCILAHLCNMQTMPYHPETNGQYEKFNQTLINMIGMLESDDKQHWRDDLPTLVHAFNCTKNNTTDLGPYCLMYGCKPRLPIDKKFSLTSPKAQEHSHNKFVARLSTSLQQCYELANRHQCKDVVQPKNESL